MAVGAMAAYSLLLVTMERRVDHENEERHLGDTATRPSVLRRFLLPSCSDWRVLSPLAGAVAGVVAVVALV